jgi:hypothetical protein
MSPFEPTASPKGWAGRMLLDQTRSAAQRPPYLNQLQPIEFPQLRHL